MNHATLSEPVREALLDARAAAEHLRANIAELAAVSDAQCVEARAHVAAASRAARVLLIDDDARLLQSLRRGLREHDVVTMTGARAALAAIRGGARFDVILCDLSMPEMTGEELYRALLLDVGDQARRMVLVTGGATSAALESFLAASPLPVIPKPFDIEVVRAKIREYEPIDPGA